MNARDFFPVADRLRNSPSEAECRTSIGRSYYGLFNVLHGALASRGVIFREAPEDHFTLISYLSKARHRTAAAVGSALRDLRQERNRADYSLSVAIDAKTSDFVF